jgi:transposase
VTPPSFRVLVAARKRIAELDNELAIHRPVAELLGDVLPPNGGLWP